MLFQDKDFDDRPDDTNQKHNDGNGIDSMHHLKVKVSGPVRVFFSEKVHRTNIGS